MSVKTWLQFNVTEMKHLAFKKLNSFYKFGNEIFNFAMRTMHYQCNCIEHCLSDKEILAAVNFPKFT